MNQKLIIRITGWIALLLSLLFLAVELFTSEVIIDANTTISFSDFLFVFIVLFIFLYSAVLTYKNIINKKSIYYINSIFLFSLTMLELIICIIDIILYNSQLYYANMTLQFIDKLLFFLIIISSIINSLFLIKGIKTDNLKKSRKFALKVLFVAGISLIVFISLLFTIALLKNESYMINLFYIIFGWLFTILASIGISIILTTYFYQFASFIVKKFKKLKK
jgi:hypothetical protein